MVLSRIKVRNVMGNVYYIFHALLNSAGAKIISRDVKSLPNKLKAYENLHAYNLWVTSRYYICFVCKKTTTQKMRMLLQCVLYIERFHFIYAFVCWVSTGRMSHFGVVLSHQMLSTKHDSFLLPLRSLSLSKREGFNLIPNLICNNNLAFVF